MRNCKPTVLFKNMTLGCLELPSSDRFKASYDASLGAVERGRTARYEKMYLVGGWATHLRTIFSQDNSKNACVFSSDDDSMFVLLFCDVLCYLDLDRFFFEIEHQIIDTMCSTVTCFHVRKKDQGIQTFEKLYWANQMHISSHRLLQIYFKLQTSFF